MRPIATVQDVVQFPLNELLGTGANVRLLRLLAAEVSGPVGTPDAAEQTGLTEAGARRALRKLVRTGFVEELGGGRAQRFQLRRDPLTEQVRGLFRAEMDRYQQLTKRLRDLLVSLPEIRVAWLDAPPTRVGHPMHIGVLSDSRSLTYLEEEVRQRINEIEREFDLTIEMRFFSPADAPEVAWADAVLLAGHVNEPPRHTGATHSERTDRTARISHLIADLIQRDSTLVARATRYVAFLLEGDQGSASHDLREWSGILSHYSTHRLGEFLRSDTARAQRLRQSSPFFAVLTPEERETLLDELEEAG
jgi:DNA-binding Lrp family transcriptional regulator